MRIAVSGTHGSGKSTLIEDFLEARPGFQHEPEPFEWLEDAPDQPGADYFFTQLQISVQRLQTYPPSARVIAERCPLDFVAYLIALDELGRKDAAPELTQQAISLFPAAMRHIDVLIVLPIEDQRPLPIPESEDLPLRLAMNTILLELASDREVVGDRATVLEVAGSRTDRLTALLVAS